MALDHDKHNEVLLAIQKLQFQFERFMSDRESEKENLKRANTERDNKIRALEDFVNELKGERQVLRVIIGFMIAAVVGIIVKLVTL